MGCCLFTVLFQFQFGGSFHERQIWKWKLNLSCDNAESMKRREEKRRERMNIFYFFFQNHKYICIFSRVNVCQQLKQDLALEIENDYQFRPFLTAWLALFYFERTNYAWTTKINSIPFLVLFLHSFLFKIFEITCLLHISSVPLASKLFIIIVLVKDYNCNQEAVTSNLLQGLLALHLRKSTQLQCKKFWRNIDHQWFYFTVRNPSRPSKQIRKVLQFNESFSESSKNSLNQQPWSNSTQFE